MPALMHCSKSSIPSLSRWARLYVGVERSRGSWLRRRGQWLIPSYDVTLADGRTITLLAIDQADIPAG